MNDAALSRVIPPVGRKGIWRRGPRRSLRWPGPIGPDGKSLTTTAPARQAVSASVGVNAPGTTGTPRSASGRIRSASVWGLTM